MMPLRHKGLRMSKRGSGSPHNILHITLSGHKTEGGGDLTIAYRSKCRSRTSDKGGGWHSWRRALDARGLRGVSYCLRAETSSDGLGSRTKKRKEVKSWVRVLIERIQCIAAKGTSYSGDRVGGVSQAFPIGR